MADTAGVFDRSVWKSKPKICLKISFSKQSRSVSSFDLGTILGMHPLAEELRRRCFIFGFNSEHQKPFRGDRHLPRQDIMSPTAGAGQPLSLEQGCFARAEGIFDPFALGDIHVGTNVFNNISGFIENWVSDPVDVLYRAISQDDPVILHKIRFLAA